MEPIAVNNLTITPEYFRESFSAVFAKRPRKTLFLCGLIVAAMGALSLALQLFFHRILLLGPPLLMMGIFVMGWAILLPRTECRKKYKALCLKNGGAPVKRRTEFYEHSLVVFSDSGAPLEVDYPDVEQLQETEHLVILRCAGRRGILLDKQGFERGSLEEIQRQLAAERALPVG